MWNILNFFGNASSAANQNNLVEFWVNDPSTPDLTKKIDVTSSSLPLKVDGYQPGSHKINTPAGRASSCYGMILNTINNIVPKINNFPQRWAATNQLNVYPTAGKDLNAFYDRSSLKFFYEFDPVARQNIYAADSADIVSHELGHALLDSIRPDFWNVQSFEIWALHESFGDIIAISNMMENEDVLKIMIKETSGDLSKSNVVSRLAEQFAKVLFNITKGKGGHSPFYLRDAVNNFKYIAPNNLKDNGPDNTLTRECHSFSRIWTGAWYECLVEIYKSSVENGSSPLQALIFSKNIMFHYFITAVSKIPMTNNVFDALAQKMLSLDADNGSKFQAILHKVFVNRNILSTNLKALNLNSVEIQSGEKTKNIKICDYFDKKLVVDSSLYELEIEIPVENKKEINKDGVVSLYVRSDFEENAKIALMCLNSLSQNNTLKDLFKVENKKLVRQKFIN